MGRGRFLVLATAVMLAGCGDDTGRSAGEATTSVASTAQAQAQPQAPATTAPAPSETPAVAETLPVIGGGTFDTATLDQGPLALWFWAPG